MMLLTKKNLRDLPPLKSQDGLGDQAIAHVKLFTPDSDWTWYITEYSPDEDLAFGLVNGFEWELGYFSLAELRSVHGPLGLSIERDRHWAPRTIARIREEE